MIRAEIRLWHLQKQALYDQKVKRGYSPLPIVAKRESSYAVLGIGGVKECILPSDMLYPSPLLGDRSGARKTNQDRCT